MKIIINELIYNKIMHWINKADFEVSGFGKVKRLPNGDLEVVDAYLVKQEGGAVETDIDEKALGKLMYETKDVPGDLRLWWHSHVKMQCFWSKVDTDTINKLAGNGWIAAIVMNQRYEYRAAVAMLTDVSTVTPWGTTSKQEIHMDDNLDMEIVSMQDPLLVASWNEEYKAKVTEKADEYEHWMVNRQPTNPREGATLLVGTGQPPIGLVRDLDASAYVNDPEFDAHDEDYSAMLIPAIGLMGLSVAVEAKMLGMTEQAYTRVVNMADDKKIEKIVDKLDRLIRKKGVSNV